MTASIKAAVVVLISVFGAAACAQLSMTTATPPVIGFVDISATGTALTVFDDSEVHIATTVGNAIVPSGDVLVSTNGVVVAGRLSGNVSFTNQPLLGPIPSGLPLTSLGILCAFWDDLLPLSGTESSTLYWQENAGVLIIMWKGISLFNAAAPGQTATFEIQVFGSPNNCGPSIQILYQDTLFGGTGASHDSGASATVGYANPGPFFGSAQLSFNTPGVPSGTTVTFSSAQHNLVASSPLGLGSLQLNFGPTACTLVLDTYILAVAIGPDALHNGWLFGLNIPLVGLLNEIAFGPPFIGDLSPAGTFQIGPVAGLPSSLTFSAVVVAQTPGLNHSGILTYTIP
jgi:hypothetical protein